MFVWNSFCFLCLRRLRFFSVSLGREHGNGTLVAFSLVEVNHAIHERVERVVLSLRYILSRVMPVATLANDDVAGDDFLASPNLYAKSL